MRRRLTGQQVDALLARLKGLKIRVGLIETTAWQFGWLMSPYGLAPLSRLSWYMLWILALMLANSTISTLSIYYFPDILPLHFGPLVMPTLVLALQLKSRTPLQAWLAAILVAGGSGLLICLALILALTPRVIHDPQFAARMQPVLTYPLIGIGVALVISLVSVFYRRRNLPRWRELVDEVTAVDAF